MKTKFEKLKDKWDKILDKNAGFGAADTEPRDMFRRILQVYLDTGKILLPLTARQWQLYDDDYHWIATEMNDHMQKIICCIDKMKHAEVVKLEQEYLY